MGRLALHLAGGEVGRNHLVDRGHRDLPLVQTVRTSLTHTRHRSKSKVYAVPCTTGPGGHRAPEIVPSGRRGRDLPTTQALSDDEAGPAAHDPDRWAARRRADGRPSKERPTSGAWPAVPRAGVEPARAEAHSLLRTACLPVHHLGRSDRVGSGGWIRTSDLGLMSPRSTPELRRRARARHRWAHLDSNQGPTGYEPAALTAELWARRHARWRPRLAVPTGFEPAIFSLTGRYARPLHYGTTDGRARPSASYRRGLRRRPVGRVGFEPT